MWILCLVYPTVTIRFCLGYKEWVFSKDLADPSFLIDLTTVVQIGTTAEAVLLSPRPRWPNSLLSMEDLFSQNVPKAADITFFSLFSSAHPFCGAPSSPSVFGVPFSTGFLSASSVALADPTGMDLGVFLGIPKNSSNSSSSFARSKSS